MKPLRFAFILISSALAAPALAVAGNSGTVMAGLPDEYFVVLLIISGILLMLAEIKITSYGILGLGGVACMVGAGAILIRTGQSLFGVPPRMVIPVLAAFTAIEVLLVVASLRSGGNQPATGMDSFIGQVAEVARALNPSGKVYFNGSYWDAVSSSPVSAGQKVRIVSADKMCLTVVPVEEALAS